ncbi:MBL fold metallo-hydrolase [Prolixibacteraceae bacterium]|nr:MBL fold metallo-hydrolase [Prolixibacteraceae bacterium]
MKITILIDNVSREGWISEHGLSLFIETEKTQILFDMGLTDGYLRNAEKAGISLKNATRILSHGHWDHGNGLKYINGGKLIAHPAIFTKRYRDKDDSYLGLEMNRLSLSEKFELQLSKSPVWLTSHIVFLGEIPRKYGNNTNFHLEDRSPDHILDDSAIATITDQGIHIITGCNHAGLINLIDHALDVTKAKDLLSITGGLHLKKVDTELEKQINFLTRFRQLTLVPLHCTSPIVIERLKKSLHVVTPRIGEAINFT